MKFSLKLKYLLLMTGFLIDFIKMDEDNHLNSGADKSNTLQSNNKKPFIPTHEWQTIEPDQEVPPGLHMRLNLETGINEAKLMDPKERDSPKQLPAVVQTESKNDIESDAQNRLNRAEVLEALKSFKADMDDVKNNEKAFDKNEFRSYDELKKDFQKINMAVKTDQEILQDLLKEYNDSKTTVERKRILLIDLEYYLHQIDNAVYFAESGGLSMLVRDMNDSNCQHLSEVLHAFGSAVQGNGKVKVEAFKSGVVFTLINLLKQDSTEEKIVNRILYSLSAFLRHFPLAQRVFIKLGGFKQLKYLISQKDAETNAAALSKRIRLKIITMINDLLTEKNNQNSEQPDSESDQEMSKKEQYEQIQLEKLMLTENWCTVILDHLSEATQATDDLDFVEKMLLAMDSSMPTCKEVYKRRSALTRDLLNLVLDSYKQSGDDFLSYLYSSAERIKTGLNLGRRVEL